jgi:hypothetical protein
MSRLTDGQVTGLGWDLIWQTLLHGSQPAPTTPASGPNSTPLASTIDTT